MARSLLADVRAADSLTKNENAKGKHMEYSGAQGY